MAKPQSWELGILQILADATENRTRFAQRCLLSGAPGTSLLKMSSGGTKAMQKGGPWIFCT